ncbi:ligand-binding sensor domain-containing protein [Rhizosphaericola mali]|uniref:Histidine kinase domain-containing protein n=1 Tax=Rhizosphaericola mali TaxID=2545455 RepID=A0A5P2G9E5_9BACT|nr:HAMP domain-containing sensor histidine kinase [Rhizosphaericola mali]QES88141.1 hypothetical protein E0W69_005500 [Rhizosphaericola mali]
MRHTEDIRTFLVKLLFLIFLFCKSMNVAAQNTKYLIQNYTSKDGLPQNSVLAIQFDVFGYCWLATEAGIVRFDNQKFQTYTSKEIKGLSSNRIRFIVPSKAGALYFSNTNKESYIINNNTQIRSSFPIKSSERPRIYSDNGYSIPQNPYLDSILIDEKPKDEKPFLHSIITLSNGQIYFHNNNNLFYLYKNKYKKIPIDDKEFSSETALNDTYFIQIFKSNRILLWKNGKLENRKQKIYGPISINKHFLNGRFKIFWTAQNNYIISKNNVYEIYTKNDSIFSKLILENLQIPHITSFNYLSKENKYFVGSSTNGLFIVTPNKFNYYLSKNDNNYENYNTIVKTSNGSIIANNNIFSPNGNASKIKFDNIRYLHAYVSKNDVIYYDADFRLNKINIRDKQNIEIDILKGRLKASIVRNNILYFLESHRVFILKYDKIVEQYHLPNNIDANGMIPYNGDTAILFTTTGFYKFNLVNGKMYKGWLKNLPIRTIHLEDKHRWWIATDGFGAFLFDNNNIIPFSNYLDNSFNSIHSFIEDKKGNYWLPTNNGLYVINKQVLYEGLVHNKNLYFFHYSYKDGLKSDEFNGSGNPAYLWANNGELILPTINGLVHFDANNIQPNLPKNKIYIDNIIVNDTSYLSIKDKLEIAPDFYNLSFTLSSPYFGNFENNPIQYFIEGLSKKWEPVDRNGIIHINTLPTGNYTLKIRKATSIDALKYEIDIKISVLPYFYETWWFRMLCTITIILIFLIFIRIRILKLKRINKKIELTVEEKTSELRNNIFTLEKTKEKLRVSNNVKERTIAIVLHDLRSPIRFISIISKDLLKKINQQKDSFPPNIRNNMDALNKSLISLEEYSLQFFSWAKSQQDDFHVNYSFFSIYGLFKEIENLYKEILMVQNNELIIPHTGLMVYSDRFILSIIIRNLIDNANKNMKAGVVYLSAEIFENKFHIIIEDTGPGINKMELKKYYNNDFTNSKKGMGHSIIIDLLPKIQATLDLETTTKGTKFNITINHHRQYDIYVQGDSTPLN